jgi:amylosucrase
MKWLYCELYHNDMKAYRYFVDMLYRAYEARPESLKNMDRAREAYPDWYRGHDLVGMLMYVNAFAGTLKGVQKKIDYITDCGVNYLHLMPLLESPKGRSDGGYAVSDFRRVQPELGTMDDLLALSEACHERGIAVCLDFVMNHTSEDHAWAKRARAGEKEYQDRYFFYDSWEIPNAYEQTVPQVFPTTAPGNFTWCEEAKKVVMTTFYPYQWDLNYANPTVFNDMTDNMLYLCNHGVDIIRLDAVPYIWKALGTQCRNLKEVHTLVRIMRMVCEIVCPGTLLLGEVVMEPSKVVPYFGTVEKPECHLLYNVTTMASIWHTVATKDVRLLRHQMEQVFSLPKQYTFLNYLRCHDDIGWGLDYGFLRQFGQEEIPHKKYLNDYLTGKWMGSFARGELYNDDPRLGDARLCGTTASLCGIEAARYERDDEKLALALRRDVMLHAYMFTLSGIPVLYSGDEIAQENDYSYHNDPEKAVDSRYLHRGRMDWAAAKKRREGTTPEGHLFTSLRRLEKLRAEHRVFDAKADIWTLNIWDQNILGIGRYYEGEKLIALYNFSDEEKHTTLWNEEGELYDLFTGMVINKRDVVLSPCGFRWLLCDFTMKDVGTRRKLIFLDIDGTLTVPGRNEPPESALKVIREARERGHKVLLCTGRNPDMLEPVLQYGFDGYVGIGGGYVGLDGEVLFDYPMTEKQREEAMRLFKENGVFRTIEAKDASYCDEGMGEFLKQASGGNSELMRWREAIERDLKIRPISEYDGRPIYKIVFMCAKAEQLAPAIEKLNREFYFLVQDMASANCINGELINRKFDKGTGVRRVAEVLGIPLEDTIGFGDSMNDAEMIETVGTGVCMENGSPALKKMSDLVCPSVENDGLAWAFRELGLVESNKN